MKKIHLLFFALGLSTCSFAQPLIDFTAAITGLTTPVDIVNAKDGSNRLFIVQQNGLIKIWNGSAVLPTPFLDLHTLITYDGGERGLLSIVFHPQYTANGYFYVFYNNTAGNTELAQYRVSADPNIAMPVGRVMLTITKPYTNHNGCKLNFGPDGDLYVSTGDGGSGGDPQNYAQSLNSYLGKMLRINVNNFTTPPYYTIPADNPLVGIPGTLPEIFDWGLRNPFRWSFDRLTGDMWIGDVGQNAWEEVDYVPAAGTNGRNFGWRCYEGMHDYDLSLCGSSPATGKTTPVFEYGHNPAGGYAIIGGNVYRGTEFPALQGWYICADDVYTNGWLIRPNGAGGYQVAEQSNFPASISGFGEAEDGTLYIVSLNGTVYKVVLTGVVALRLVSFDASFSNSRDLLHWKIEAGPDVARFEIERSGDGLGFAGIAVIPAETGRTDYFSNVAAMRQDRWYRLKIIYNNGSIQYSDLKKLSGTSAEIGVSNEAPGFIRLHNSILLKDVCLLTITGQKVTDFGPEAAGDHTLNTAGVAKGIYVLMYVKTNGTAGYMQIVIL